LGIRIGIHCEDISIIRQEESNAQKEGRNNIADYLNSRPVIAEILAVTNVIELAKETKAKVHICHVSHPDVAEVIKKAKAAGLDVTAETCSHYLIFNDDIFKEKGPLFKCAPPIRSEKEREQLWAYVLDGTLDCLASDHSPCAPAEKEKGLSDIWQAWTGISGLQTTFQIMFNEMYHKRKLNPALLAKVLSYNPSRVFGLYPRKGALRLGSDADLVIVNPETPWNVESGDLFYKNPISAFVGTQGKGIVEKTIIRGEIVFDQGIFKVNEGFGIFINPRMM
jgi:allantoinase